MAELLDRLVEIYVSAQIPFPKLRAVTLAHWVLASDRASSKLATDDYNFANLQWRPEMAAHATPVTVGGQRFCRFATIEAFVRGYWAFLNRAPYSGWEQRADDPEDFFRFVGKIISGGNTTYADRVLELLTEAEQRLALASVQPPAQPSAGATKLGAVVIDPGHGGAQNVPGSSANNAISVSGVKEKQLTLDFCMILRDELLRQATAANEEIEVVLTRTADLNLTGTQRAAKAKLHKAKLFLCIHFNGLQNPATRGPETFFRAAENGNQNLEDDRAFARVVHTAYFDALKALDPAAKDRGVKPDSQSGPGALGVLNDTLLGNVGAGRPCRAAYMELEFITNPGVDKLLVSGPQAVANRTRLMGAVAEALRDQMRAIG